MEIPESLANYVDNYTNVILDWSSEGAEKLTKSRGEDRLSQSQNPSLPAVVSVDVDPVEDAMETCSTMPPLETIKGLRSDCPPDSGCQPYHRQRCAPFANDGTEVELRAGWKGQVINQNRQHLEGAWK